MQADLKQTHLSNEDEEDKGPMQRERKHKGKMALNEKSAEEVHETGEVDRHVVGGRLSQPKRGITTMPSLQHIATPRLNTVAIKQATAWAESKPSIANLQQPQSRY